MKNGTMFFGLCLGAALATATLAALAQDAPPPAPTIDADGTVHGALNTAPISNFLSTEAKAALAERMTKPPISMTQSGLAGARERVEQSAKESLEGWLKIYPSTIEDTTIGGVHVFVITPKAGIDPANKNRVLIGAHQGGFNMGRAYSAQVEAVPLAGRARIKVIAVDYRLAPEAKFPAASEDMEAVYREVLKTSKPANVGIFGCSAGGTLVAESMAWFQKKNLPRPGAISIMCSGAMKTFWFGGDSQLVNPLLNGTRPFGSIIGPYFTDINLDDPLVTPGQYPEVLAKFPPTLLVTGTRDIAMSNAITTHAALLKAGADAQLFVQEGLGHGHFYVFPGTPESLAAYNVIWKFFDSHLKK